MIDSNEITNGNHIIHLQQFRKTNPLKWKDIQLVREVSIILPCGLTMSP